MEAKAFCDVLAKLPNGVTILLDNARIHHAGKCLTAQGPPAVAELAESKSITP